MNVKKWQLLPFLKQTSNFYFHIEMTLNNLHVLYLGVYTSSVGCGNVLDQLEILGWVGDSSTPNKVHNPTQLNPLSFGWVVRFLLFLII